jgi:BirA family transcriptional regulator, biotin operon repressor / biotin---[acetyl-CoA-carboxylase] ligase
VARGALFERLAFRFDEALGQWRAGAAFEWIRSAWLAKAVAIGGPIRIENHRGRREGTFEGLDAEGRLLFRGESGIETVETADLWILPAWDRTPQTAASASHAGKACSE